MVDKSHIDILQVCQRYTSLKRNSSYNGGQWVGPCPICADHGKDRFHVWPQKDDGIYWCRQCQDGGDVIKFIQQVEGVDFKEACRHLGIQLDDLTGVRTRPTASRRAPIQPRKPQVDDLRNDYPAYEPEWQQAAQAFVLECADRLTDTPGAMAYLTDQRHLTEPTIHMALLGFNDRDRWSQWGSVKVWLPRGIVIPWITGDFDIWRIRFRCLDDGFNHFTPANGMKYPQVKGSANGLYFAGLSRDFHLDDTVVLVEGEFDALVIHAQMGFALPMGVRAIATGGTNNARVTRWVDALNQAGTVFLAFDSGETGGPMAALWWSGVLDNASRLIPTRHDVTDMVADGVDLYRWLNVFPRGYVLKQLSLFDEASTANQTYNEVM